MDDKNKIKNLEIQIDNLITEKHIKDSENALSNLEKKKEIDNTINLIDNQNNVNCEGDLNIIDIILGLLLIVFVFNDFKKMCSLNILIFLVIIVIFICISLFIKPNINMLGFIKIVLGLSIILIIYFDKNEYFDFNVFKVGFCVIGLYIIYNSFNNNIKTKKSLPDYRNKSLSLKVKSDINNEKKYEGGEFKGCVNIDNINSDESENKLFYKGGIYNLGQLIIDNRNTLSVLKSLKEKDNNTKNDTDINNRYIFSQCLDLLSVLKKNNNNGDLLFLLEILVNEKKTYGDIEDNIKEYTKEDINEIIKLISDNRYFIGSICFNNISI
tara:strand:- start:428 stop:1405 length:978 start_codon:yes stop_codon:yes gene_type:complete